jgi:hypothetical protein
MRIWSVSQTGGEGSPAVPARLVGAEREVSAQLIQADVFALEPTERGFDLLIANALLDLVDVPTVLPHFWRCVRPGGFFWFTSNFDGETIFLPEIDRGLEAAIMTLYHRSMDQRVRDGRPAGDSRCGRKLFSHITAAGGEVLAAGASDWIVHPVGGRYPADEQVFLHHIIDTVDNELRRSPALDSRALAGWVAARHRQIEAAELIYMAKQLDVFGRVPAADQARA